MAEIRPSRSRNLGSRIRIALFMIFATWLAASATAQIVPRTDENPTARPEAQASVYLVTFRPGTPAAERAAVAQGAGATVRMNFTLSDAVSVFVPNDAAMARLRNDPRVMSVVSSRNFYLNQGNGRGPGGRGGGGGGNTGGGGGGGKPKAPSGLAAAATSSSEISLIWNDGSNNEDGFTIERCMGAGCSDFSLLIQVPTDTTSYNDTGLTPAMTYGYRVQAYTATATSKYSNTSEATTDNVPQTPPAAPDGLLLTVVSHQRIDVSWSDNSPDEDGFEVERCEGTVATCSDGDFAVVGLTGADAVYYPDNGLSPDMAYAYRVNAVNGAGPSGYAGPAEATTTAAPASTQVVPTGVQRIGAAPGPLIWTGAGVGAAIVDTGVDFSHPDLPVQPEVVGVNSFNALGGTCQDIHGHGTHVAGTVAAMDNLIDVVGVAPGATIYCVNVFEPDPLYGVVASDESLIAGLEWIAANANLVDPPIRVINMSLGRPRTSEDTPDHPMHLAVKALYDAGISVVVSAGNDSTMEGRRHDTGQLSGSVRRGEHARCGRPQWI